MSDCLPSPISKLVAVRLITHPVAVPDADDPGVVRATVVERVDPDLAAARADSAASLESTATEAAAVAAPAIRISCFGKERREE